ncbi:MAG TPA: hypothetical protein VF234_07530 [Limnochordia bacterium]
MGASAGAAWVAWAQEGLVELAAAWILIGLWYGVLPAAGVTKRLVAQLGPFADLTVVVFLGLSLYAAVRLALWPWRRLSSRSPHPARAGALIGLGVVLATGYLAGQNPLYLDLFGIRFSQHAAGLVLLGALAGWAEWWRRQPARTDEPRGRWGSRVVPQASAAATRRRIAARASRR